MVATNRQIAGPAVSSVGRSRDAEQLGDLDTTAMRTAGQVTGAADQGLEGMVARLAVILIEWHTRNDSSVN